MSEEQWKEAGGDFGVTPRWTETASTEFEIANTMFIGNSFEGIYVEELTGVGSKNANLYVFEECSAGEVRHPKISMFGSTVLDGKFLKIPVGSLVKVEHLGMEKSKKGGNDYRNFKVLYRPAPMKEAGADLEGAL